MLKFKYCFIITIITSQYLYTHVLSQGGTCPSKDTKLCACVPRYRSQFKSEYLLFRARRCVSFSVFIHLIAETQFSSSAKIRDYNYICFIFAIKLNSFPCGNNVLFSWAGSSEMQQILAKNCEHQRWAVWTFWCEHWAACC